MRNLFPKKQLQNETIQKYVYRVFTSTLFVVLMLFGILVLCVLGYWFFYNGAHASSDRAVRDTSEIYLREIAEQKENQLQINIDNLLRQLAVTTKTVLPTDTSNEANLTSFLKRMKEANEFDFIGFLDGDGIIHTVDGTFPGMSKFTFINKDFSKGAIEFNNTIWERNLVLAIQPLDNVRYGNTTLKALIGGVDASSATERLSLFDNSADTICELIDTDGGYVIQATHDHLGTAANFLSAMEYHAVYDEGYSHKKLRECIEKRETSFVAYSVEGVRYFTYLTPVDIDYGVMIITIPCHVVNVGVEAVRSTMIQNSFILISVIILVFMIMFILYYVMRRRQDEIIRAQIQAEENNRAKTDFLSQMSHDIRTPMNAIIGFTNFAVEEEDSTVIKDVYLPKIQTASKNLLMLINDVLEMSRIESGKLELVETPCDLAEISRELTSVISVQADEKNIALHSVAKLTNSHVYCDRLRVTQIITNLLGNAVKFTPKGGEITVSMEQYDSSEDGYAMYELQVSDTGIGMPPEFVHRVFEPFERERTSTMSGMEGTGLGLAIVRNIVEAMNGMVAVKSKQGEGTTFTVRLKLRVVEKQIIKELSTEKRQYEINEAEMRAYFEGKRLLLVEDNEFNRMIAETMLTEVGFIVDQAVDGTDAVDIMQTVAEGYYEAILMDVQMPIMNGYEATKVIRKLSNKNRNVKIIAVTANAFESDINDAKAAGMNAHVPKPINVEDIYKVLWEEIKRQC